jgi:hypothetical protein
MRLVNPTPKHIRARLVEGVKLGRHVDAANFGQLSGGARRAFRRESASLAENSIRLTVGEAGRTEIRLIQTCGIPALSILVGVEMEAPPIVER